MSRLDSFIRRLEAQRACLEHALDLCRNLPGPIFELGLGNGRTYDHLREKAVGRDIYVFERKVAAHPDCIPPQERLFEGPIDETLPQAAERFAGQVALLHADLGSGRPEIDAQTSAFLASQLPSLMAPGGIILSDQPLPEGAGLALPLPQGVAAGRYYFFQFD